MGNFKIPSSFVQDLLSRVDIVDIISHYVPLKQVGRNFSCLCPFHPEKTPSFFVSPEKQIFKCFGCGIAGNAITFVEKYENLSFPEAVKRVAELSGIELPSNLTDEFAVKVEEAGFKSARFFHDNLKRIEWYLEERKISLEVAKKFLLGFAPAGYSKVLEIEEKVAKELGLISDKGREFFAERLIIPIFSHSGSIVAFGGRAIKEGQEPKYINSPESSLFKKSNTLYGFYQAKDRIFSSRTAVLVEGYFDVISAHMSGVENAVAPMGTSLTENHVKILSRRIDKVILMFDGDSAGIKATIRSAGMFLLSGVEVFVADLPDGEDPDSLRKDGKDLKEFVESSKKFEMWFVEKVKHLEDSEKIKLLKEFGTAISRLKRENPFLYKELINKMSVEFDVEPDWFEVYSPRTQEEQEEKEPIPFVEKAFLRLAMENKSVLTEEISSTMFTSTVAGKIYALLSQGYSPETIQVEFPELTPYIAEIQMEEFTDSDFEFAVKKFNEKILKRLLRKEKNFEGKLKVAKAFINVASGSKKTQ